MSQNRFLDAVHLVARLLSTTTDIQEAMRGILEAAMQAVGATGGSILRHEPRSKELRFRYVIGPKAMLLMGFSLRDDQGIVGTVFQTNRGQIDNNPDANPAHDDEIDELLKQETRNLVTVPIAYPGGVVVGVMQLVNKPSDFTDEDLTTLDVIASIAAMSIERADLAEQGRRTAVVDYLGDMAHDIRDKVTPISSGIELLDVVLQEHFEKLRSQPNSDEYLGAIQSIAEVMEPIKTGSHDLIRYVSFLSDMLNDQMPTPQLGEHLLSAVADYQLDRIQARMVDQYEVKLVREHEPGVKATFDRFMIGRALRNLVENAFHETPEGGTVKVHTYGQGDRAVFEVADTGRGITEHVLKSLLRGEPMSTRMGRVGLGVAIVKKVVDAHRGEFEGESTMGKGTTFRIRLPMR
ncbi:MAG: GAF domain-containing protein [Armatimonadetes bacterium]|nr:GAF domain-containing protein [Armatimonadota bacterium]